MKKTGQEESQAKPESKKMPKPREKAKETPEVSEEELAVEKSKKRRAIKKRAAAPAQEAAFESAFEVVQTKAKIEAEAMAKIEAYGKQLKAAITAGDLPKVQELIASPPKGFDINACTTPYMATLDMGNGKIVENNKANAINKTGGHIDSLLMTALTNGRFEIFQYLVEECGADILKSVDGKDVNIDGQKLPFGPGKANQILLFASDGTDWEKLLTNPEIAARMDGVHKILSYLDMKTTEYDANRHTEAQKHRLSSAAIKSSKDEITLLNLAFFYMDETLFTKLITDPSLDHNPAGHRRRVLHQTTLGLSQPSRAFATPQMFELSDAELHIENLSTSEYRQSQVAGLAIPIMTYRKDMVPLLSRFGSSVVSADTMFHLGGSLSLNGTNPTLSESEKATARGNRNFAINYMSQIATEYPDAVMSVFRNPSDEPKLFTIFNDSYATEFTNLINSGLENANYPAKLSANGSIQWLDDKGKFSEATNTLWADISNILEMPKMAKVEALTSSISILTASHDAALANGASQAWRGQLTVILRDNAELASAELVRKSSTLNTIYSSASPALRAEIDMAVAKNLQPGYQPLIRIAFGAEAWGASDVIGKVAMMLQTPIALAPQNFNEWEHFGLWAEQFKLFFDKEKTEAVLAELGEPNSSISAILKMQPDAIRATFIEALQQSMIKYKIKGDLAAPNLLYNEEDFQKATPVTKAILVLQSAVIAGNAIDVWRQAVKGLLTIDNTKAIAQDLSNPHSIIQALNRELPSNMREIFVKELRQAVADHKLSFNVTAKGNTLEVNESLSLGKLWGGLKGAFASAKGTLEKSNKEEKVAPKTGEKLYEGWTEVTRDKQQEEPPEKKRSSSIGKSASSPESTATTVTSTTSTTQAPGNKSQEAQKPAPQQIQQESWVERVGPEGHKDTKGKWTEKSSQGEGQGGVGTPPPQ